MKVGSGGDPYEEEIEDEGDQDEEVQSVPWIFTRKNVKSGRDMVQFYLRNDVQDREEEFVKTLEDKLGTSIPVTDAREAAYLAAMDNPEKVVQELREWGFHLKE